MKTEQFNELMGSMQQALDHARGKRVLRTTLLPAGPTPMRPADVKRLRRQVNASQAVFAHYLNVSTQLVQAWEAGRRRPEGAALRLLHVGRTHPAVVFGGVPAAGDHGARGRRSSGDVRVSRK
jgi:putative transcriptional regulator